MPPKPAPLDVVPLAVVPPLLMLPDDVVVPLALETLLLVAPDAVPPVVTVGAGVVTEVIK